MCVCMDKQIDNLTFSKLSSPGRDRVRGAQFPTDGRTDGRRERARGETGEGTDDRSVEIGGGVGRTDGRTRARRSVFGFGFGLRCVDAFATSASTCLFD